MDKVGLLMLLLTLRMTRLQGSVSERDSDNEIPCLEEEPPKVTLLRLDDLYNESFTLEESEIIESVDMFHYTCTAAYPIDVISNYEVGFCSSPLSV